MTFNCTTFRSGKTDKRYRIHSPSNQQWLKTDMSDRSISNNGTNSSNQCWAHQSFTNDFLSMFGNTALDTDGLIYRVFFSVDYEITCPTSTAGSLYWQMGGWPYCSITDTLTISHSQKGTLSRISTIKKNDSYSSNLSSIYCRMDGVPTDTVVKFSNWRFIIVDITKGSDPRPSKVFHASMGKSRRTYTGGSSI